jgi:agmatinase
MSIRGLSGLNLISADVVEVSPAYDHAEVTSLQLQLLFMN